MTFQLESGDYAEHLEADLELAERVHRSMIPRTERQGCLDVACRFTPMMGVGGDYASVFFQSYTKVLVSVCDVAGHGIASALLANRVNSFVLSQAPSAHHPCQVGESLNAFFYEFFGETNLLASFFCLFLDLKARSLAYAGFGHPPVFLIQKDRTVIERLDSGNTLIGISKDLVKQCSMLTIPFDPGDRLILYTDGISEAENKQGEQIEIEELQVLVHKHAHLPAKEHVDAITDGIERYRQGAEPQDDQLLLAISFLEEWGSDRTPPE